MISKIVSSLGLLLLLFNAHAAYAPTQDTDGWKTIKSKWYTFSVPSYMEEMEELNDEASHQYGYVESIDGETLELYLIVLQETHKEIAKYDLGYEFTALSYSELAVGSLEGGLDEYRILTKHPEVKQLNGMDCVLSQMEGRLGTVDVFYKMGVFKGEKAFYQVLTWTISDQKDRFGKAMQDIINSFREN